MVGKSKHGKELLDHLSRLYLSGSSVIELSNEYGIPTTTIYAWVYRNDLNPNRRKLQTFNRNYFENIDTEDKAYFLGFIIADGCVTANKCLVIKISEQDIDVLQKFQKFIGSNYKYSRNMWLSNG